MNENWIDMPSEELAGRLIEQLTAMVPECGSALENEGEAYPEPAVPAAAGVPDGDGADGAGSGRSSESPYGEGWDIDELERAAGDPEKHSAILEAVLFAAASPVDAAELAQAFAWPLASVQSDLEALEISLARRGIRLQRIAGACRLVTAAEYAPWVERYLKIHNRVKLSRAQLETLAIIAYNQPITRAVIDTYRGVRSERVLTQLEDLRLIKEVARAEGPGRPILYGTTREFLRYFALDSLRDLPLLFPAKAKDTAALGTGCINVPPPASDDEAGSNQTEAERQAEDKQGGLGAPSESLRRLLKKMQRRQEREAQPKGIPDEEDASDRG